jgi:hypothetical protein
MAGYTKKQTAGLAGMYLPLRPVFRSVLCLVPSRAKQAAVEIHSSLL